MLLVWMLLAAAQACVPTEVAAWRAEVEVALQAWTRLDEGTFTDAVGRVHAGAPCLAAPIAPSDAASWHLLEAVAAWHDDPDHPAAAVDHLRVALSLELDPDLLERVLPANSPLDALVKVARAAPVVRSALPERSPLRLRVDGVLAGEALALPALVQLEGRRGVLWTRVLPSPLEAPAPRRRWLVAATGVSAGVAALLWGGGVGTRLAWEQGGDDGLWRPNQALLGASAAAGGVAVGFGVATLVDALRARRAP
jgi:hypothetical protein